MSRTTAFYGCLVVAAFALVGYWPAPAPAYVGGPPASLGMMCYWSTHAMSVRVERIDREKNIIIYRKLLDLKGKWPKDVIRHVFPAGSPLKQRVFDWAEVGKITMVFALESYKWSHIYIDDLWYMANTADWEWWNIAHEEPIVLRSYCGKPERLVAASLAILAGKEVVVPCRADASPEELRTRKAKLQRLRSSLKLLDYNPKRDFVGWGGDDFLPLTGMPGFMASCTMGRVDPEAQAVSVVDFNRDGKLDLCLAGAARIALWQNAGDYWADVPLGTSGGCRSAVWADYDGDGLPDLLLAAPSGPKLLTNLGNGNFRDDSALLPPEPAYSLTAASWIDYNGDGLPDILLANGFHGLRLYRNRGRHLLPPLAPAAPPPTAPFQLSFEDVSETLGLLRVGGNLKGDTLTVCDVNGDGRPDFLYGARTGLLVGNTPEGFVELKDSGISYRPGKVGPVFGDYDGDGHPDLFVPQLDGRCKLFKNDGKGRFNDLTAQAGGLAVPLGMATAAAWGDFDNDGRLDLVIGCLRGPNRFFRNLGTGRFEDATTVIGLNQRIYNTQAISFADLNNDGTLDLVFVNEGQESVVLLGRPPAEYPRTPLTVQLGGPFGVVGGSVQVLDSAGKLVGRQGISGGDGRGSQQPPIARFALTPGGYKLSVRFSSGITQFRDITVGENPLRTLIDEQTARLD